MDANTAIEIAASFDAPMIFNEELGKYQIYIGEAHCNIDPDELEKGTPLGFKAFIVRTIHQEAEIAASYGGRTYH